MFKKILKFQKRNFSNQIKKNPIKNILNSTKYILNLRNICYQENLSLILQGYYRKKEIDEILKDLQKNTKLSKLETIEFFNSINNIYSFLEKSNYGFLSGDFQPEFLLYLKKLLEKEEYNLSEIAFKLFQSLNDEKMKLPEGGIKFPDIESQSSLFERQLLLENLSYENSLKKILGINEDMISFGNGIDTFLSSILIETNFDGINKLISKEMEIYSNIENINQSNYYNRYFSVLSSEIWTMISLVSVYEVICGNILNFEGNTKNSLFEEDLSKEGFLIKVADIINCICVNLNKELKFEIDYKNYKEKNSGNNFIMNRRAFIDNRKKEKKYFNNEDTYNIIPEVAQNKIATILTFFLRISYKNSKNDNLIFNYKNVSYSDSKQMYFKVDQKFVSDFYENLQQSNNLFLQLDQALPLIYPPAKWESIKLGGYYLKPSIFMKCYRNEYQKEAIIHSDLSRVYSIVDYLSNQPWKIDKYVLSVVEKIWNNGGGVGTIPFRYDKDLGNKTKTNSFKFHVSESIGKKGFDFSKEMQMENNNNSIRSFFLLRMDVANAFKDMSKIYFPHNLDFRGRVYPIPPHLNHMGDDLSRSLLIFSDAKKLGKGGLRWLKIHLANKMGRDKLPLYEREAFIDDNLSMLEKWHKNPIKNSEWLELESCWQSLGALNELFLAIKSKDPSEFLSSLPVHQDGTCNGLQHYAAIGRDLEGAKEVNLVKMNKPGDVYTKVCNMVINNIKDEIKNDLIEDESLKDPIRRLLPVLKRKIVKQTVMTTVYGVTFIGAKDQIQKQLKEYFNYKNEKELNLLSIYLAKQVLKAVSDLFSNAHKIKEFLTSCVDVLNKNEEPMSWFTPLGLPISQPYRKEDKININMNIIMDLKLNTDLNKRGILKQKQKSAFPPNFIHSLDSTHLMMTAERMKENGLNFATVHDSFWTHACDVDDMSVYLREEFIKLYKMDLLGNLKKELEMRFPEDSFPDVPSLGDLDLNSIMKSDYFFS